VARLAHRAQWGAASRGSSGACRAAAGPPSHLPESQGLGGDPGCRRLLFRLAASPAGLALLLGVTFVSFALLALSFWCAAGGAMGRRLRGERQWAVANGLLGALLAGSVVPIWWS